MKIEEMSDFFTKRVENYDKHMLNEVKGCKECYEKLATLIPKTTNRLLDLGCGTGLELEEIFKVVPNVEVTGIDLTQAMLDKLREKYSEKNITLINGNYLEYNFGTSIYDIAISFQTMHHFLYDDKIRVYEKVYNALNNNGKYIECDYMLKEQKEEEYNLFEYNKIRKNLDVTDCKYYHYDIPYTIDNQINMIKKVGFSTVSNIWCVENTTILVAQK